MSYVRSSIGLLLLLIAPALRAQPVISYLFPDIGAAEMNTYVDIIAPFNATGGYGSDGLSLNNSNDVVRIECVNAADTNKIKIGPAIVSWSGRTISTQIFVMPNVRPNSTDWQALQSAFRIPIHVVLSGRVSNADTFYLVAPQAALNTTGGVVLGSGGQYGTRSRRGAMLFEDITLGKGLYKISTMDCDPATAGNQGYLPAVILARHTASIANGATLDVSGDSIFGGPGGGGGSHGDGPVITVGGDGFTGGSSGETFCPTIGGAGSGGPANGTTGGPALNGLPGGSAGETEGVGGSGNPFVATAGGINESNHHEGDGNGGSFATKGDDGLGQRGSDPELAGPVNGNDMLIPLMGGSGGGGGNEICSCAKTIPGAFGGGGGGALRLFAPKLEVDGAMFRSVGASGFAGENGCVNHRSVGGCGSGGAIEINGKLPFTGATLEVSGGTSLHGHSGNGSGGSGRRRLNGPSGVVGGNPITSSLFMGPSTDTIQWVKASFQLTGTGKTNSQIILFLKPETGSWHPIDTLTLSQTSTWKANMQLPTSDTLFFLCAAQINPNPSSVLTTMEPAFVMSQAGANSLRVSSITSECACLTREMRQDLVAYWPFCNGTLNDESGNGHIGTPYNSPSVVTGEFDEGYLFNGSNGIDVPFSSSFDIPTDGALTLSAWVKPEKTMGFYQALVVKGSSGNWDYGLYIDKDNPRFMFGCSFPNHEVFSTTQITAGTWYHVCGVYRNSAWKIFVNGKLEEDLPNGTPLQRSTNGFGFGKKGTSSADPYTGALDEVRLYDRALSDSEVLALYQLQLAGGESALHAASGGATSDCERGMTDVQLRLTGCASQATLDSVWLTGSTAFAVSDSRPLPRGIGDTDSVAVSYLAQTAKDTATLHLRYHLGNQERDTTIAVIGHSSILTNAQQHLAIQSGSMGDLVTLPLSVDLVDASALKSSWSNLTEMTGEVSYDQQRLSFVSFTPATGWTLNTLGNTARGKQIVLTNASAQYSAPLALGDATFKIIDPAQGMTVVTLDKLTMHIAPQENDICLNQTEDALWAIVVRPQADVMDAPQRSIIQVRPNPFDERIQVGGDVQDVTNIECFDILGHRIHSYQNEGAEDWDIRTSSLSAGSYFLVCRTRFGLQTFQLTKLH